MACGSAVVRTAWKPTDSGIFQLARRSNRTLTLALILLLAVGLWVRVHSYGASSIIAERQFRSALIARAYYYESATSVPDWKLRLARITREREGVLEPPILEWLVAALYRVAGGEHLWIAASLSTLSWMVGAVFLFLLASRLLCRLGAFVATAVYVFNFLGIHLSISFVPDPLMMCFFLISLYGIVRYYERPTTAGLLVAAVLGAVSVLVKPMCLFGILGAFTAMMLQTRRQRKHMVDSRVVTFFVLILLPVAAYYGYGIAREQWLAAQSAAGIAREDSLLQPQQRFLPHLLLHLQFWKDWIATAADAFGVAVLLLAALALAGLPGGRLRALLLGLLGGYLLFGLLFTYHIRFADYYHVQLLVVVALAIGYLGTALAAHARGGQQVRYWWASGVVLVFFVATAGVQRTRHDLQEPRYEPVGLAKMVGNLVNHSERTLYIASYYGKPLQYFGEFGGASWPRATAHWSERTAGLPPRTIEERLSDLGFTPEFVVVTSMSEYQRHHGDLDAYLRVRCDVLAERRELIVFGECEY